MILPDCPIEDARLKAKSLRLRIEGLVGSARREHLGLDRYRRDPRNLDLQADLVAMADNALYLAKRAGRDCVSLSHAAPTKPKSGERTLPKSGPASPGWVRLGQQEHHIAAEARIAAYTGGARAMRRTRPGRIRSGTGTRRSAVR